MQVMNALHDLTVFIEDEAQKNKTPEQTAQYLEYYYEYVQYSGNIIPRLYLLNCVGGVCLKLEVNVFLHHHLWLREKKDKLFFFNNNFSFLIF